jgi:WD40-like Beta Propeller Repeat
MNTKLVALAILTIGAIALTSATVAGSQALAGGGDRHGLRAGRYPHGHRTRGKLGSCTMAEPQAQATVEVLIPDASDFCELVSKVLATDVFHAPVSVVQGRLWHSDDATLSCLLQYRNTRDRAAIYNSVAACRWFRRLSPGWHTQPARPRAGVRAANGGAAVKAMQPGLKIAFVRTAAPSWDSHIFVMNPDGSVLRQLTDGDSFDWNETWSPDGSRLLFERLTRSSSSGPYQSDIYVVRADGTGLKRLTDSGSSVGASWSPDGRTIAYGKGTRLFLMNADGSRKRQLTQVNSRHAWAGDPSWSPDGKIVAFDTGDGIAYVMTADGTRKRQLTRADYGWEPVWSPRGNRLAVLGGLPRYSSIYVLDPLRPGPHERRVTLRGFKMRVRRTAQPLLCPHW